ncbi:DUF2147 domain-containing protein [Paraburkholderia dipogonis]
MTGRFSTRENGKLYKCKMHLEDGGTNWSCEAISAVSLLGRSQTWIRQQ